MDFLFDTHLLLWALEGSEKLPKKAFEVLMNPKNQIFYSVASMWEVSIKNEKKKLNISGTEFMHYCEQAGYKKLPIDEKHILALETLEKKENSPEHNDLFDRILLSQAKSETMNLLTCDKSFSYYNEPYYAIL